MAIATFELDPARDTDPPELRFSLLQELFRTPDAGFWRALDRAAGTTCVVRVIDMDGEPTSRRLGELHRERALAERVGHPAVLRTDMPTIHGRRICQRVEAEPARGVECDAEGGRLAVLNLLVLTAAVLAEAHACGVFHGAFARTSCLRTSDGRLLVHGFRGDGASAGTMRDGAAADHRAFLQFAAQMLRSSGGAPPRLRRYFSRHLGADAPLPGLAAMAELCGELRESLEDTFPWPIVVTDTVTAGPVVDDASRAANSEPTPAEDPMPARALRASRRARRRASKTRLPTAESPTPPMKRVPAPESPTLTLPVCQPVPTVVAAVEPDIPAAFSPPVLAPIEPAPIVVPADEPPGPPPAAVHATPPLAGEPQTVPDIWTPELASTPPSRSRPAWVAAGVVILLIGIAAAISYAAQRDRAAESPGTEPSATPVAPPRSGVVGPTSATTGLTTTEAFTALVPAAAPSQSQQALPLDGAPQQLAQATPIVPTVMSPPPAPPADRSRVDRLIAGGNRALAALEPGAAVEAFDAALAVSPGDRAALAGLQRARRLQGVEALLRDARDAGLRGDHARAVQGFAQALSNDPRNRGLEDALATARRNLARDPTGAILADGYAALGAGHFETARAAFEKVLQADPAAPGARRAAEQASTAIQLRDAAASRRAQLARAEG